MRYAIFGQIRIRLLKLNQVHVDENVYQCSQAGIAKSVERLPAWSHTVSGSVIGPSFKLHQCLLTGMWKRTAWLPCWPRRGQQVLHQR